MQSPYFMQGGLGTIDFRSHRHTLFLIRPYHAQYVVTTSKTDNILMLYPIPYHRP